MMPCLSNLPKSSRSVSATPSKNPLIESSSSSSEAGTASKARRRLSATPSISRAKFVAAYLFASSRSRLARRIKFSFSAKDRSNLSFSSASSSSGVLFPSGASDSFSTLVSFLLDVTSLSEIANVSSELSDLGSGEESSCVFVSLFSFSVIISFYLIS